MEYDAGLFFIGYQREPRASFIHMLAKMATLDMLNPFATAVGSGIVAIPSGAAPGEYIGQRFFS